MYTSLKSYFFFNSVFSSTIHGTSRIWLSVNIRRYSAGCSSSAPAMLWCEAAPVQSPPSLLFFCKNQQWQNKHPQTSLYSDTLPFEGWTHRSGWNICIWNLIDKVRLCYLQVGINHMPTKNQLARLISPYDHHICWLLQARFWISFSTAGTV